MIEKKDTFIFRENLITGELQERIIGFLAEVVVAQKSQVITERIRKANAAGNKHQITNLKKELAAFYPCLWLSESPQFACNETVRATGLVQFDVDNIPEKQSKEI